jgi:hypothetical protein
MDKDELFRRVASHFKEKGIGVEDSGGDARLVITPARALETLDPAILDLKTEVFRKADATVADVFRELSAAGRGEELALDFVGRAGGPRLFFFKTTEEVWPLIIPVEIPPEVIKRVFPPSGDDAEMTAEELRKLAFRLLAKSNELSSGPPEIPVSPAGEGGRHD